MKKLITLTCFLCMITTIGYSQMSDVKDKIIAKEKEMYESIKSGDLTKFKANLARDFLAVYGNGMFSRTEEIKNIESLTINSYEFKNVKVILPADNVAIIAYQFEGEGVYGDEEFSGKFYASSVWVKKNGEWKAYTHTDMPAQMEDNGDDGY